MNIFDIIANYYDFFGLGIINTQRKVVEIVNLKEKAKILDIGCGTGNLLKILEEKNKNFELIGIDPNEKMLNIARKKLKFAKTHKITIEKFNIKEFDYVFSIDTFHHLSNPNKTMKKIFKILVKNGKLIVLDIELGRFLNYLFHFIEPDNKQMHTKRQFVELFEKNGFKVETQIRISGFFILTIGAKNGK